MRRRITTRLTKRPITDFFDNVIEIGDRYFYGSPDTVGVVTALKHTSIEIEFALEHGQGTRTMKCRSPNRGVCLDKVPGAQTEYKVTWKVWKGIEPCGKAEYSHHSQTFDDLATARACFETKKQHCNRAKLGKVTTTLLDEAED